MGRRLGIMTAALLTAVALLPLPAAASGERALWVWDGPVDGLVEVSIDKGITDLYVHAAPGFSSDPDYSVFLTEAHGAGLQVHAMAGDPAWAKQSAQWEAWVDEVVAHGGFDGVVFDVEPYLHPDWGTKKQGRLIRSFLAGLDGAAGRAGGLPVLAAVPFWFDELRVKRNTLVEQVLDRTDGIVVLAYRDFAEGVDGIIDHSSFEASRAAAMGKEFLVGVETAPAGLDKVSFAEEGEAFMEGELLLVEAEFAASAAYGGIAVHHYGSYATMAP